MARTQGTHLATILLATCLLAGCGGTPATTTEGTPETTLGGLPQASPTPPVEPSPTPTAIPSQSPDLASEAWEIIHVLGGDVPLYAPATFTYDCWPDSVRRCVRIETWEVGWDSRGKVIFAFDQPPGRESDPPASITKAQAAARAVAVLDALGVETGPPDQVGFDQGAWGAYWNREEDGVPVFLDGISVYLEPDGSFRQYTYSWHELAPKPDRILTADEALSKIASCHGTVGSASPCSKPTLEWYQVSDGPDPLRLSWVLSQGRLCMYAVDAGTGEVFDFCVGFV
jgi:hypothetical protein